MIAARSRSRDAAALSLFVAVLVALAYAKILRFGLVADARLLIRENTFLRGWDQLVPNLVHDYFWSSSGASIPYWRPITKASWLVEWQLGGGTTWIYFAAQQFWLIAGALGVAGLVRRLDGNHATATIAALLFALHPAAIEPTALVMARSDLVAVAALLWSVCGWLDWQRGQRRGLVVHIALLVVALGSKEASVVVLPIVAWWWWLQPAPRAFVRLAPATVLVALYLGLRALVLRGAESAGVVFAPLRLFVVGARYLRALVPLPFDSGIRNLPIAEAQSGVEIAFAVATWVIVLLVVVWVARAARRSPDRRAWWLLIAIALPLAPVLIVKKVYVPSIEGKLALADRWLLGSLAFAAAGLALLIEHFVASKSTRGRRAAYVVAAIWVAVRVFCLPTQLAAYASEDTLLDKEDATYRATPAPYRTVEDQCRAADRRMLRAASADRVDEAEAAYREQPAPCAARVDATFNLLALYVRHRQFAPSRALVDALLLRTAELDERNQGPFAFLAGEVLVETGEPARGQALLEQAIARGVRTCGVLAALGRAFELQGDATNAALAKSRAQSCYTRAR